MLFITGKALFIFELTEKEYYTRMLPDELIEIQNKNTHNFVKLLTKPTEKILQLLNLDR